MIGLMLATGVLPQVLGAYDQPAVAALRDTDPFVPSDALRRLEKPDLDFQQVAQLTGAHHRVTFYSATWDGGAAHVRDLEVWNGAAWVTVSGVDARFDEQWVVLTSTDAASADYYYAAADPHWVALQTISQLSSTTVELTATDGADYSLVVRWVIDGDYVEVQYEITALQTQHYVVGYQSMPIVGLADVDEVLCGSLQHARTVKSTTSLGAWELFAPMSLTERTISSQQITVGVYIPGDVLAFEHDRALGSDRQPFGMSLRNDTGDIQPVVYAPQAGLRSVMTASTSSAYAFGVAAMVGPLYEAYVDICRDQYGLTSYRENVYDTSLTDAVHNMMALAAIDPASDDSEDYVPSFSGWWSRAKGFIDLENNQSVRAATASALLSAFYLTATAADQSFYDKRARPMLEYQVSRRNVGTTPVPGSPVYGDTSLTTHALGSYVHDASVLVPMWQLTKGQNGGLHRAAKDLIVTRPAYQPDYRSPWSTAMQAWQLSGDPARLAEATAIAKRYARDNIDTPYTSNVTELQFAFTYSKSWIELFMLFEHTGDPDLLAAAYTEVKRFITQTTVRPVPSGTVSVPPGSPNLEHIDAWGAAGDPSYPHTTVSTETVPKWLVSTSGLTFEQLITFKLGDSTTDGGGGYVLNPMWAPALLRLSHHTADTFIRDVARNMVVGRFTNYPGYYNKQFVARHIAPDYALTGPSRLSAIYYHHIPGQIELAIDFLLSECYLRSGGAISFPGQFESTFVYFRVRLYGAEPGTFYGETGVWPHFPADIIAVDDPQINWVTGVSDDDFYVALSNMSASSVTTTVTFDEDLTDISPSSTYSAEIIDAAGSRTSTSVTGGSLTVTVPAGGITSIVVRGAGVPAPWHWTPTAVDRSAVSYSLDDADPSGPLGMTKALLIVRPDRSGMDAYVQTDSQDAATMTYSINGGANQTTPAKPYPYEWTIPLSSLTDTFTYQVSTATTSSPQRTLRLPPSITSVTPTGQTYSGEVSAPGSTTPGDTFSVRARIRSSSTTNRTGVVLSLTVPSGWSVANATGPSTLPAGGSIDWTFDVTASASATIGNATISGSATWTGGAAGVTATSIEVLQPVLVTAVTASPARVKPGESTTLTIAVLNRGPASLSPSIAFAAPSGWSLAASSASVTVPARSEQEITVVATAGSGVTPDAAYSLTATPSGGAAVAVNVQVDHPLATVITADSPYPRYFELGHWISSGLPGFEKTISRYSATGVTGGSVRWTPDLPASGTYEVFVWFPANSGSTTSASYTVHHASGDSTASVNQSTSGGSWVSLGSYSFAAGSGGYLRLDVTNTSFHRASAARFLKL
ncbi:NEW3 domain-containing protein [Leifsonia sp. H3M29-4]|uniref:golvesin C-terminal-like domain-containing protein n=1 Tax=Salinibacterium metalliresistens TaxID=3031321 RepID=UPI0023DC1107|nr:NEW3 domain-containing protein [Salinibacterium metalliresistens]MDF1478145.1 NEW3 domain-containing protein [Salinibacterium metalliresistens]